MRSFLGYTWILVLIIFVVGVTAVVAWGRRALQAVPDYGFKPSPAAIVASPSPKPQIVQAVVEDLALKPGVSKTSIRVVSVDRVEWPNACLGVVKPGVMCAQVITPGYKIVIEANGNLYVYHTDLSEHFVVE